MLALMPILESQRPLHPLLKTTYDAEQREDSDHLVDSYRVHKDWPQEQAPLSYEERRRIAAFVNSKLALAARADPRKKQTTFVEFDAPSGGHSSAQQQQQQQLPGDRTSGQATSPESRQLQQQQERSIAVHAQAAAHTPEIGGAAEREGHYTLPSRTTGVRTFVPDLSSASSSRHQASSSEEGGDRTTAQKARNATNSRHGRDD